MVEVRIRLASDVENKHLGYVPFTGDGLDNALQLVRSWGLMSDGDTFSCVFGQFVIDDRGAYFELVTAEDE